MVASTLAHSVSQYLWIATSLCPAIARQGMPRHAFAEARPGPVQLYNLAFEGALDVSMMKLAGQTIGRRSRIEIRQRMRDQGIHPGRAYWLAAQSARGHPALTTRSAPRSTWTARNQGIARALLAVPMYETLFASPKLGVPDLRGGRPYS